MALYSRGHGFQGGWYGGGGGGVTVINIRSFCIKEHEISYNKIAICLLAMINLPAWIRVGCICRDLL